MKIVTFIEIEESFIDKKHTVEYYQGDSLLEDADIAILDIDTIFDFEENKVNMCADNFVSVAIIDDDSDYDAFKNFGIDTWIKSSDLNDLNSLLNLIEKRFFS